MGDASRGRSAGGAWFVPLHVREGTYDGRRAGLHGIHNAEMATYLPAIAEITRRGGWVIRMGDPGMSRMPPLPNVIDYCHSDLRADWMDIFIATQGRFMLGVRIRAGFHSGDLWRVRRSSRIGRRQHTVRFTLSTSSFPR